MSRQHFEFKLGICSVDGDGDGGEALVVIGVGGNLNSKSQIVGFAREE